MNKKFSKLVEDFKLKVMEFEKENKVKSDLDFSDYHGFKEYEFKLIIND